MNMQLGFEDFNSPLNLEPVKFSLMEREEGPGWSFEKVQSLETWYRRFLYLVYLYPEKTIVPTKDIDTFWHTHILDTQKYTADCKCLFGHYFHHFPYFGMRGEKDRQNLKTAFQNSNDLYFKHFGESPLSLKIADCGALCNEPTPKSDLDSLCPDLRPRATPAGMTHLLIKE